MIAFALFAQLASPPSAATPSAATPASATAPAEVPEEVSVRGKRVENGDAVISAAEAREMPGAFGDTMRAVEALPGVVPVLSGLPYYFIRGSPPNNNGFFVDGIRVPLLFHIGIAQSVIHPGLIERVDFQPGAPAAKYGGFAGAFVNGELKAPSHELHGEANVRLVDAGALVEAPFAGDRGTALVAARYGYPGPILGLFVKANLEYWDYQARTTYAVSDRDTLGVFAFGNRDVFGRQRNGMGPVVEDIHSDVHRIDLRWDHALEDGNARVAATLGYDRIGSSPVYLRDRSGSLRAEIDKGLGRSVRVRGGLRVGVDDYDLDTTADAVNRPFVATPRTNFMTAVHGDVVWKVGSRVEIVPGARVETFSDVPAFDPRLSARVGLGGIGLGDGTFWISTAGLLHQYESLRVQSRDIPFQITTEPGFLPGQKKQLQEVAQASQGIEVALPGDVTLTTTAFVSGWTNMTDLYVPCDERETGPPNNPGPTQAICPSNASVHGKAYGVEFLARRALTKRFAGWLSATVSRSTRETHFQRSDGGENVATVPSEGDHLLVANAIATYDLGRRWRIGGRVVFYTGAPYSNSDGDNPIPPYNAYRFDPFFRLDARVEKRWPLGKKGSIAFVAEVQNLTLSKESFGHDCTRQSEIGRPGSPNSGPNAVPSVTVTCKNDDFGPVTLPSIGVEAQF